MRLRNHGWDSWLVAARNAFVITVNYAKFCKWSLNCCWVVSLCRIGPKWRTIAVATGNSSQQHTQSNLNSSRTASNDRLCGRHFIGFSHWDYDDSMRSRNVIIMCTRKSKSKTRPWTWLTCSVIFHCSIALSCDLWTHQLELFTLLVFCDACSLISNAMTAHFLSLLLTWLRTVLTICTPPGSCCSDNRKLLT